MAFAHLSQEERVARSRQAVAARYGSPVGDPAWFCGRCGHNSTSHASRCRKCDCLKWVHHLCPDCGEWMAVARCANCERIERAGSMYMVPTIVVGPYCRIPDPSSPDYQWLIEKRRQREWLKEGKQTLTKLRLLLRNRRAV